MPYHIVKKAGKFYVEKQDGSKSFGAHDTEAEAKKQMAALYAVEPKSAQVRQLHLVGALGTVRTEMVNGKEHLVVPCVALQEGVIHAVNAKTPEFVPASSLLKSFKAWDGHPLVVNHPIKDGKRVSANDPFVLEKYGFGVIRGTHMKGSRLGLEALVDPSRLELLGQQDLLKRLRAGEPVEVSVGAFVLTSDRKGEWEGKPYQGQWEDILPDHLAFLPDGIGACSLEMGCGAHRHAVAYLVTAESFQLVPPQLQTTVFSVLEDVPLDDRLRAVEDAVYDEWNNPPEPFAYAQEVFDDFVIVRKGEDLWSVDYTVDKDGKVALGKKSKVKMAYVAATKKCHACKDGHACDTCKEVRVAKSVTPDATLIQAIRDQVKELVASFDRLTDKKM